MSSGLELLMPACRFRRWPMRLSLRPVAARWRRIDASLLDGWVIHWELSRLVACCSNRGRLGAPSVPIPLDMLSRAEAKAMSPAPGLQPLGSLI
jgi:hypothetical protein